MLKFDRSKFVSDLCELATRKVPFSHQGGNPETGIDCINVARYAYELQKPLPEFLVKEFEAYEANPNGYYLLKVLRKWVREIPIAHMLPADLLVFNVRRNPKHMAVLISETEIVEAYQSLDGYVKRVLRHPLDPHRPIANVFRIPDFT